MALVAGHAFGQLFITDVRPERTFSVFNNIDAEKKIFEIKNGEVNLVG
jgi:DNA replication and repair protein RecF